MTNEIVAIPYHTMSARADWLRKRMAESGQAGSGYQAASGIILLVCIAAMIAAFAQAAMLLLGGQVATASQYFLIAQSNQLILQIALGGLVAVVIPTTVALALQPTHLLLTDSGLQFSARTTPMHFVRRFIGWDQIEQIECTQSPGRGGEMLIVRGVSGEQMRIKLANLSQQDRLKLLDAIRAKAPLAVQEPAVVRALTASRDQTYTEIWLQAFAAPPKHESMVPVQPGAILADGKYKVESQLGAGGLGTAYLAGNNNDEKVVLKEFILPVFVDAAVCRQALKSFEAEAKILKSLNHVNIVTLLDYFVSDQRAYMVLEYIDGVSLKTLIERDSSSGLSEQDAIPLAVQMCQAISHLHEQAPPVVHRDVTPENLILNSRGTLKLIDFNVAQQAASGATAIFVGKPGYLPPEQFRGEPTVRSDIYAAGATLHYLLTGREPIALSVSHPKSIRGSSVSAAMDEIVAKATSLDEKSRYASASELQTALESLTQQ
jgi:tRNA A-37 threonylcarbamoyl transferase component Bud32